MQGTCMDARAMKHNLAPHINSDHYVQPSSPQPQTATDVIKNHNAHEREVNNAIDQAFPVQYLKDMVPAQTMNQRTNEVKCNGKLLRRSESGRKIGEHSHRLKKHQPINYASTCTNSGPSFHPTITARPAHHDQLDKSINPNTAQAQTHIIINSGDEILPDKSIHNNNFASFQQKSHTFVTRLIIVKCDIELTILKKRQEISKRLK